MNYKITTDDKILSNLTDTQITDLARPLMGILQKFYEDPKNEEDFQKWLRNVEKAKRNQSEISQSCIFSSS